MLAWESYFTPARIEHVRQTFDRHYFDLVHVIRKSKKIRFRSDGENGSNDFSLVKKKQSKISPLSKKERTLYERFYEQLISKKLSLMTKKVISRSKLTRPKSRKAQMMETKNTDQTEEVNSSRDFLAHTSFESVATESYSPQTFLLTFRWRSCPEEVSCLGPVYMYSDYFADDVDDKDEELSSNKMKQSKVGETYDIEVLHHAGHFEYRLRRLCLHWRRVANLIQLLSFQRIKMTKAKRGIANHYHRDIIHQQRVALVRNLRKLYWKIENIS